MKKTSKEINVNRVRSTFAKITSKIGAETANVTAKIVINNPALLTLTLKSSATISKIPPMMSSAIPTTKARTVNI